MSFIIQKMNNISFDGGGFCFFDTPKHADRYALIGLGKTGCAILNKLDIEGKSGYCTIKIDKEISSSQKECLSDFLSRGLENSWATLVLIDLNDDIDQEVIESIAYCCHQESELSIAIVIDQANETFSNSCHLQIFKKFGTYIYLPGKSLCDISNKIKKLSELKEFVLAHLTHCYLDILLGNGVNAIDHIDLKNLFLGKLITVGVGVAHGEGGILEAFRQALNSPQCNGSQPSGFLACLAMSGSALFDNLPEVETALESLGTSVWLADVHSRDELNGDLLLTLFVVSEQSTHAKERSEVSPE